MPGEQKNMTSVVVVQEIFSFLVGAATQKGLNCVSNVYLDAD